MTLSAVTATPASRPVGPPQVAWRSTGGGTSTPLLLVNGFGASANGWPRAWVTDLAADTRVIRVDNRGGGWSRSADIPFGIADMAGDVIEVLDHAEIERAVILGVSMGGMIAQQAALDAPERVAGLVLVGTRPPAPYFRHPELGIALALVRPVAPGQSLRDHFRRLWSSATAPGFAASHPEAIDEFIEQSVELPTPRTMLVHQMRAMAGWGHGERLRQITAPTVVVHGMCDRFTPIANGEALVEHIPGAEFVRLPDVGHLVPQEAPARLAEVALEMVARTSDSDAPGAATAAAAT